jgi:hypothetical protein
MFDRIHTLHLDVWVGAPEQRKEKIMHGVKPG